MTFSSKFGALNLTMTVQFGTDTFPLSRVSIADGN